MVCVTHKWISPSLPWWLLNKGGWWWSFQFGLIVLPRGISGPNFITMFWKGLLHTRKDAQDRYLIWCMPTWIPIQNTLHEYPSVNPEKASAINSEYFVYFYEFFWSTNWKVLAHMRIRVMKVRWGQGPINRFIRSIISIHTLNKMYFIIKCLGVTCIYMNGLQNEWFTRNKNYCDRKLDSWSRNYSSFTNTRNTVMYWSPRQC